MKPLSPSEVRRAWRIVTWAGLLGSIYFLLCIGGAPRIKYLTELGATAFDFGLMAGFGAFALVFQLVGSFLSNRAARRKPIWMATAIAHRAIFLAVLVAPFAFDNTTLRISWIILIFFCHDALANMTVPLWLSWMADLIPKESLSRHWATRQRFITALNIVAMVLLAIGFHYFEARNQVVLGFTIIAAIGVVLGVIDICLFRYVPEPPNERPASVDWKSTFSQPLRDPQFRPFLNFMGFWHFSIFLAAPFFGLFLIDDLKMSVLTVQLVGIAASIGVVVSSNFWGLLCDTYGFKPVLQILTFGKAFTPLAFMLTPRYPQVAVPFLAIVMFLDGALNSGVNLAVQGVQLKSTPRQNRTTYIAAVNFLSVGIMATIAPIVAGEMIDSLNVWLTVDMGPYHFTGYHWVFAISFLLRLGSVAFASRLHEPTSVPLETVSRQVRSLRGWKTAHLAYRVRESENPKDRLEAARHLGRLRNPMAIGDLIGALQDEERAVREAAADSLGRIGVAEAAEPLARALFDPQSGIQSKAARALGRIGGMQSLRALLTNLRNLDSESLIDTIDSLGRIGDSAAIVPLISLFHDVEDERIRHKIAEALGKLSETESVDEVLTLLSGRRSMEQRILK